MKVQTKPSAKTDDPAALERERQAAVEVLRRCDEAAASRESDLKEGVQLWAKVAHARRDLGLLQELCSGTGEVNGLVEQLADSYIVQAKSNDVYAARNYRVLAAALAEADAQKRKR